MASCRDGESGGAHVSQLWKLREKAEIAIVLSLRENGWARRIVQSLYALNCDEGGCIN